MSASDSAYLDTVGRALLDELGDIERELWLVVVVTLLADVWLTHVGLQQGLHERNPAVRLLVETSGIAAVLGLKLLVLGVAGLVRELVPGRQAPVVPLGLSLPWGGAALVNAALLLGA